ncbi:MAG: hypothetical protein HRU26_01075 [Psychroserpens sp.]|nr:hypothetical protein [Psychroserpens sp.]
MKKGFALLAFFALFTAFQCDNEPIEGEFEQENEASCEIAAQNTQTAALAFLNATDDNFTQLCTAYRNAIQVQIEFCGDPNGILQTQLDSLGDCGDDNQQQESSVVGTWLLTAWIGEEPFDLNNDGTGSINFLDEMECYENETLVFSADNTVVNTSTSFADIEFIIEVGTTNSVVWTVDCIEETEITNGTWSQSGNIVSISDQFGDTDWTLNGNELSIFVPEGFVSFNSDDFSVTTIQDLTFIYTKQ